jgi:flagellar biosynthetic protein FliR
LGDLIAQLADAFTPLAQIVWPIFGLFARLSLFFMLVPVFGENAVPARVRLSVAALAALLLYPVMGEAFETAREMGVFTLLAKEAVTGFIMGFSLRLFIHALQFLGMIISQSLSLSQPLGNGISTEPNTTISTLMMMAGATLLVTIDMHIVLFGVLVNSFHDIPLGLAANSGDAANWLTEITVSLFRLCLSLALPFLILNFAYNLILGFLNRAMPQLLVSFVGLPGITLAGLFLLMFCAAAMLTGWLDAFGEFAMELS